MGAEREDTDPNPKRVGTEPGLGKSSGQAPAAEPIEEEELAPVDFDALHAALGDPLDYDDLGSNPIIEIGPDGETVDAHDGDEPRTPPPGKALRVGESSGQSSATYASARPHTIPPTRAPIEDRNVPAVIVSSADTVPSAPPLMTVPMAAQSPHGPPQHYPGAPGAPGAPPHHGGQGPGSNPAVVASGPHAAQPAHPSSGPHPSAAPAVAYPHTPPHAFAPARAGQMTMRMPDRPLNPRRGKTPTIVVRPRGPSAKQKLIAFMAMLLLCTACGIAVIIVLKPRLLGLDTGPAPSPSASPSVPSATGALVPSSTGATTGSASAAAASSSGKIKPVKPPTPRP